MCLESEVTEVDLLGRPGGAGGGGGITYLGEWFALGTSGYGKPCRLTIK